MTSPMTVAVVVVAVAAAATFVILLDIVGGDSVFLAALNDICRSRPCDLLALIVEPLHGSLCVASLSISLAKYRHVWTSF